MSDNELAALKLELEAQAKTIEAQRETLDRRIQVLEAQEVVAKDWRLQADRHNSANMVRMLRTEQRYLELQQEAQRERTELRREMQTERESIKGLLNEVLERLPGKTGP